MMIRRKPYDSSTRRRATVPTCSDPSSIPHFIRRGPNSPKRPTLQLVTAEQRIRQPKPKRKWPWILLALLMFLAVVLAQRLHTKRAPHFLGMSPDIAVPPMEAQLAENQFASTATVVFSGQRATSFAQLGERFGFSASDMRSLEQSVKRLPATETEKILAADRSLTFALQPDGLLARFIALPEPARELVAVRSPQGEFHALLQPVLSGTLEHVVIGVIRTSFSAAAQQAGVDYGLIDDLVDLFSDRIEFSKDFQKGDRFSIIYRDETLNDGRKTGKGQILAAAIEIRDQHLIAVRYVGGDGKARYFDETGKMLGNFFLRYPLKFSRISSVFSESRFHPVLRFRRPHNGVDFAAPIGTPVRTVADGVVVFAGRKGGSGNMVKIRHSVRYATAYLHLNSIAKGVKNGARLQKGEVIGAVGMTGLATGPHLHFSFYDNEKYVDPMKVKLPTLDTLDSRTKINDSYLKRVIFTLKHYQTVDLGPFYTDSGK